MLEEIDPHDVGVADRNVLGDCGPHADDRVFNDRAATNDGAVANQAVLNGRAGDPRAGRKRGRVKIGPASEAKSNVGVSPVSSILAWWNAPTVPMSSQ